MVFLEIYPNTNNVTEFDNNVNSGKHVFALVYMEGCGPCHAIRPEWKKLESKFKNNDNVAIIAVDQELSKQLTTLKNKPGSFPHMVYIHEPNIEESYEGERSIDALMEWIDSKTKAKKGGKRTRKTSKQRGGIIKVNPLLSDEEAFDTFVENSSFRYVSQGTYGITFEANINPAIPPIYTFTNSNNFGDPVEKLLIKFAFIHDQDYEPEIVRVNINGRNFTTSEMESFKNEVNIQTDIFLKTMNFLQPICPPIVYSDIYTKRHRITKLLQLIISSMGAGPHRVYAQKILDRYPTDYAYLGVIAMEFASDCRLLHYFTANANWELYKNMALYLLLRLAIETGYTHGDFHPGNIFINTTSTNYFAGTTGSPLLIDFGQAQKIPLDILKDMKDKYQSGNYTGALARLCEIDRPDGVTMDIKEIPYLHANGMQRMDIENNRAFYGYACGTYDYKNKIEVLGFLQGEEAGISQLVESREPAIDALVKIFEEKHAANPDIPLLPLSNAIKNKMHSGLIGGKHRKNRKNVTKKRKGGKWSLKYKKSINCKHPKGFSQKQHCKYGRKGLHL